MSRVSRRLTAPQKISLRTSILDKNLERERLHLLDEAQHGPSVNFENGGIDLPQPNCHQNGGYGSLQPCEQNGDSHTEYANTIGPNDVDCNHLQPPRYVRSFSSGGKGFSNYDEGIVFGAHGANLANSASQTLANDCGDSVLQYSPRPLPKRYEVPAVYFFGRGGSARGSVSSTTNTQSRTAAHGSQFQPHGGDSYAHIGASFRDLNGLHDDGHYATQNNMNMADLRDAPFGTNDPSTVEGGGATPNIRFDDGNDFFVNFNATLDRLPALQRELGRRLRRHLQFFFMNPLQKYQIRRQFPFKLFLQILKVVFITIQLILFAELRISHVDFLNDSVTVMRHRFLKNWDNDRDEVVYPPDSGKYSVFTSDEIVEHFGYIVKSYYTLQNDSFASYSYDTIFSHRAESGAKAPQVDASDFARIPPIRFCRDRIADVTVQNDTYIFDISQVKDERNSLECFLLNFTHAEVQEIVRDVHNVRGSLVDRSISFGAEDALSMSKATLAFNLRTIHFSPLSTDQKPECYLIKITIEFDNSRHTGQVFVRLNSIISYINLCNGRVLQVFTVGLDTVVIGIIDVLVLLMCLFSLLLCSRALIKAHLLKKTTCEYFSMVFNRKLSVSDQLEFFNLWYVMILVNDILIVLGTVCKVTIEFRDFDSDLFTLTGIMLGFGALLVYIGLLRYLGFFSQYNFGWWMSGSMAEYNFQILVLTLKRSLPSILRFMVCTIILYAGFLIAGWVIIGPYSIKFRTLSQSSEALFSLLNGDDMFATFYTISDSSTTIKVVGTIYIYFFVSLFIYIVLSLFIAIIMDSYEVVKERYDQSVKVEQSTLYEFLASAESSPDESSPEAREIFAADRLLRLDDGWLLQNWSEIRSSLRQILRNMRNGRGGGAGPSSDGGENTQRSGNSRMFGYDAFENPAHDSSSGESVAGDGLPRRHSADLPSRNRADTLISTLANGGSIAIAIEQHDNHDDDGGSADSRGTALYQVSPRSDASSHRRYSPKTPRLELTDDETETGVVRLDGFDPHDEGEGTVRPSTSTSR